MRKADVEMHSDGYGRGSVPAVNVKVYCWDFPSGVDWSNVDAPEGFTADWIVEHLSDEDVEHYFTFACESAWEDLQSDAEYIFGDYNVTVESQGRSGGWAVVDGLPDFEEWDAVLLAKWARFAKWARAMADDIPGRMAELIGINRYEWELQAWADAVERQTFREADTASLVLIDY
jgi:hypothetical protein